MRMEPKVRARCKSIGLVTQRLEYSCFRIANISCRIMGAKSLGLPGLVDTMTLEFD